MFCLHPAFVLVLQDKVNKEVNYILANQETIQSQITQLEAAIKQTEVNHIFSAFNQEYYIFYLNFFSIEITWLVNRCN